MLAVKPVGSFGRDVMVDQQTGHWLSCAVTGQRPARLPRLPKHGLSTSRRHDYVTRALNPAAAPSYVFPAICDRSRPASSGQYVPTWHHKHRADQDDKLIRLCPAPSSPGRKQQAHLGVRKTAASVPKATLIRSLLPVSPATMATTSSSCGVSSPG